MKAAPRLCAGLLAAAALGAYAEPVWQAAVDDAIAAACAVRGLTAREPIDVRPMAEFHGGYTPGIGSVVWPEDHAEQWRAGWCALGVYCAPKQAGGTAARKSPLQAPSGLFDVDANVLYVRDVASSDALDTVAHEATHALQHQNFPHLRSAHLWYNRDVAAAANAASEGDAHVVGRFFDDAQRLYMCSTPAAHAAAKSVRRRAWRPDNLWALEGFPHVFGTEPALKRWLAGGASMDDWLRDPPLATLAVLRPALSSEVDFIGLADDLVDVEASLGACVSGLANTAGAVGIWGLLAQHGNADAQQLPAFVEHWRGDRFRHVACTGHGNDELAWVSRWRSVEAAEEFAGRYRAIAASIHARGGVLAAAPMPFVRDATVVVATPGLFAAVARLAEAPVRTFARFSEWWASGCFPQDECYGGDARQSAPTSRHLCAEPAPRPARFDAWLARIRSARTTAPPAAAEIDAALDAAAGLAKFCAVNRAGNTDLAQACQASYRGISYQARLLQDVDWRLLPYCASAAELRDWYRATYHADADRPFSDGQLFTRVYGAALAAGAVARGGVQALAALAADPPLSTLAILNPSSKTVDFIRLRDDELAPLGCEIASTTVQGVLSAWGELVDRGALAEQPTPPAFLFDWRGDRQAYVRCGEHEGWVWVSRWASEDAAHAFAAAAHTGDGATIQPAAAVHTVWIAPAALAAARAVLQDGLEVRSYSTFAAWRDDGCFPQPGCNRPTLP